MTPARDPFYIVKEEIQASIDKLQSTFKQWEQAPLDIGERVHLTKELLSSCESIEWQVDELDKAIAVAVKDPARYSLDVIELERRRKRTVQAESKGSLAPNLNGAHHELMRHPNDYNSKAGRSDSDTDDFISSESDRQLLLMKQQDEELDELSASVQRIGGIGLTIHDELVGQERILDDLSLEMETTSNRLDFVQKKVAVVMKKAVDIQMQPPLPLVSLVARTSLTNRNGSRTYPPEFVSKQTAKASVALSTHSPQNGAHCRRSLPSLPPLSSLSSSRRCAGPRILAGLPVIPCSGAHFRSRRRGASCAKGSDDLRPCSDAVGGLGAFGAQGKIDPGERSFVGDGRLDPVHQQQPGGATSGGRDRYGHHPAIPDAGFAEPAGGGDGVVVRGSGRAVADAVHHSRLCFALPCPRGRGLTPTPPAAFRSA
ncbi:hypothetical protein ZIOFF_050163 [Zingiber officinale]|uniref:t-SNARE coiled-coil homology domain-containing protein n=1 Tax=Zingiber officinale TaxID=94328 RepID=A0A8J5FJU6_ZINOF|nr:hypothetical protein ZIOFF_050163 [Zingiber officinale]